MKIKIFKIGIGIFICCIFVAALFLIDDLMKKNYNVATPSSGIYDAFVKYDEDLIKYARDVYSDEEMQRVNDEYDKKVEAGILPLPPHLN